MSFEPHPALAAAIANVNLALGQLAAVVDHRGGANLPALLMPIAVVDGFEVQTLGQPARINARRVDRSAAEAAHKDALRFRHVVEELSRRADVDPALDFNFSVVSVEANAHAGRITVAVDNHDGVRALNENLAGHEVSFSSRCGTPTIAGDDAPVITGTATEAAQ